MKFSASTLALLVVCATLGHLDGANAMERGSGPQLERLEEARQLPRNDYALSKLTLNMQVRQQLDLLRQSGQLDNRPVIADQYKFKSRFWSRKSSAKNCDPRRRRQWAFAKVLDYYTSAALRNSRAWPWSFRGATTTKLLAAEEKLHLLKGTLGMFFIASNKERQFPIASGTLDKRDRMFSEELVQLRLKLKSEYAALEGEVRKAHMRIMYGKMRKLPLVGAPITKVDEVQAAQSVAKLQYALERELQKLMIGVEDNNAALQVYYCGAEFEAAREEAKEKSKSRFRWPDLSGARTTAGNAVGTVRGFFGGLFGSRSNPSQVKTSPDQVD